MTRYKLYLTSIALLAFTSISAQLNGNYTIGGINPDYSSPQSAAGSLQDQGISGPVTFLIRPGTYSGFSLGTFANATGQDTVVFKAENGIASSVIINSRIVFEETVRVHLNRLTITGSASSELSTLFLDHTNHCLISYCNISNPSGSNYDDDEALIKIEAPWEGSYARLTFDSCIISSPLKTIDAWGKVVNVYINRSVMTGCFKLGDDVSFYYNYNTISILDYYLNRGSQRFTGNEFHIPDTTWILHIDGKFFNNTFNCLIHTSGIFIDNIFKMDVEAIHSNGANFRGNLFEGGLTTSFCHGSYYSCNIFKGECNINSDASTIWNNFFFNNLSISHGPGQWVEFNNFHPNATAFFMYVSATIRNNNFGNLVVYQPSIAMVTNNNFVNGSDVPVSFAGVNPSFYDPGYIDPENDLRATNPALIQKSCLVYSTFRFDIDSIRRNNAATIGANEVCLSLPMDTVYLHCGDSLCLDLCMEDFEGYFWTPSYLFNDSTSSSPYIFPQDSIMIKLNHEVLGVVDSLMIMMIDSLPVANCSYVADGNNIQFVNKSGCAGSYLWEFGDGATSVETDPLHTYPGSGFYSGTLTAYNTFGMSYYPFNINIVNPVVSHIDTAVIRLFPIPASDKLCLGIPSEMLPLKLNIIDMQGISHYSEIIAEPEKCININNLPAGMYMAVFNGNSVQFSRKLPIMAY